jgi:hypothetical protein
MKHLQALFLGQMFNHVQGGTGFKLAGLEVLIQLAHIPKDDLVVNAFAPGFLHGGGVSVEADQLPGLERGQQGIGSAAHIEDGMAILQGMANGQPDRHAAGVGLLRDQDAEQLESGEHEGVVTVS